MAVEWHDKGVTEYDIITLLGLSVKELADLTGQSEQDVASRYEEQARTAASKRLTP